ncbi:hypothetical protein ARMSODRAFT_1011545 [Armillaria solidipes]|uniref:Uncharacterized protein n=1 Tax=Armillaria solidipes TaxID=1076256 RepID=A0A2H3C4Q1_9AGAR|nr:hypothetical protein ARMSODRAFT_1011545 [Armillaria solidipes]
MLQSNDASILKHKVDSQARVGSELFVWGIDVPPTQGGLGALNIVSPLDQYGRVSERRNNSRIPVNATLLNTSPSITPLRTPSLFQCSEQQVLVSSTLPQGGSTTLNIVSPGRLDLYLREPTISEQLGIPVSATGLTEEDFPTTCVD